MDDKQTNQSLDQVLNSVRNAVEDKRRHSEAQPARKPRSKQTKIVLAIALCIACAALLIYRLENVAQPNQWPDLQTSPQIVQASIVTLVEGAEAYKAKNGNYPIDLGLLDLSLGLHQLIDQSTLVYKPGTEAFTIDWTLPNWHAQYDSKTREIDIASTTH